MTDRSVVLEVMEVGKRYRTFSSLAARVAYWFGLPSRSIGEHVALDDVSFDLCRGDTIAFIGQNGAGKSTLLKIITGTVRPTSGAVRVSGRLSAILELGLGFNPEFTGRENVMSSGGMLGYSEADLKQLMPEIEAFAEIGEHFDAPVRTYSSGMQARLSFALATASRPEILIVDEVLSVGDAYFQHKSFARIREFRDAGTTLILVTHSMADVRELCQRVLLIDKGRVIRDGMPDEVIDHYNALIAEKENDKLNIEQRRRKDGWSMTRSGDFRAIVREMELVSAQTGEPINTARVGEVLALKTHVEAIDDLPRLVLGLMLRDRTGHVVWGSNTWHTNQTLSDIKAGNRIIFTLEFRCTLGPGSYSVSPALVSTHNHLEENYEWIDNYLVFDVINADRDYFIGSTMLDAKFLIEPSRS